VGTVHGAGEGANEARVTLTATELHPPTITKVRPRLGPASGDTVVKITGTNFKYVSSVTFGGVAVSKYFVNQAQTQIAVVTPPQPAGLVNVVVHTLDSSENAINRHDRYRVVP
jgi:hypothetical protein